MPAWLPCAPLHAAAPVPVPHALTGLRAPRTGVRRSQVLELSETAQLFLEQQFTLYDARGEGMLSWEQLQGLFSTAPSLPTEWQVRAARSALARAKRRSACRAVGSLLQLPACSFGMWRYVNFLTSAAHQHRAMGGA